jgi:hypothetical protein
MVCWHRLRWLRRFFTFAFVALFAGMMVLSALEMSGYVYLSVPMAFAWMLCPIGMMVFGMMERFARKKYEAGLPPPA